MRRFIFRFIVALVTFAVGTTLSPKEQAANSARFSIVTRFNSQPPSFKSRPIELSKGRVTVVDLELGEDIDNAEVTLVPTDNSVRYRIFQRYRTSMTVMAEGPHLDLIDWRHFDSAWIPLRQHDRRRFRTLRSNQMDSSKFPPTTTSEILKEVRKQVGIDSSDMLDRAKTCKGPNDSWCAVMISSIYLRVERLVDDSWTELGQVEFRFPMGC